MNSATLSENVVDPSAPPHRDEHAMPEHLHEPEPSSLPALVLLMGVGFAGVAIALFGALSTWAAADLGLTPGQSGIAQTAFFVGHLSGSLLLMRLMQTWTVRRCWMVSAGATALGSLLTAVPLFPILLSGRVLAGLGFSSMVLLASACICSGYAKKQVALMNCMHGTIAAAAAGALLLGRPIGEAFGSWELVFVLNAGLALLPAAAALFVKLPAVAEASPAGPRTLLKLALHPAILLTMPAAIGYVAVEQSLTVFLPGLVERSMSIDASSAAALTGLMWVGIIAGRFFAAGTVHHVGESSYLLFGTLGMSIGVMLAVEAPTYELAAAAVLLAGFAGGPIVPLVFSYVAHHVKDQRNAALTACSIGCCMGGLIGPSSLGSIGDASNMISSLTLGGAILGVGVAPVAFLALRRKRVVEVEPQV